jgi:M6 family metalloprotease-like protein
MSQPSTSAAYGWGAYVSHHNFIQEAMDLADADVNFAGVHQVLIITPPSATAFTFSAALVPNPGDGAEADGVTIDNAVTLHNTGFFGGRLLNHESGHSLGLIDLYAYEGQDRHRFVGGFDAMGLIAGFAPEYMAYHRWMLAWLADSQIFCQQTNEETVYLTPIEKPGGVKALMVPVGPTTLVVVESRRAIGYDNALPKEGVLVYVVDSSISTGQGGIQVHPQLNDPLYYDSPLAQGEQVTVQGMTIEVIEASAGADLVRVTNNN